MPDASADTSAGSGSSSSGGSGSGSSSSGSSSGSGSAAPDAGDASSGDDGGQGVDGDAAPGDDGGPPADAAAEGDGPPTFSGMAHVAVLYDPSNMNGVADLPKMLALLMAMPGLVVEPTDDHVRAPMLASKQLIIIMGEASTFGGVVDPAIRDLSVPVILSKDAFARTLMMGNDQATSANQNSIK